MRADETIRRYSLLSLWKQHPFRLHIAVFFTTMVFLFGVVLAWSNYLQGRNLVLSSSEQVFERIEREIRSEMLHMNALVEAVVNSMSGTPITDAATFNIRMQFLEGMAEALNRHSMLESIYVGYYNGDFFQLHALRNDADRKRFGAPRQTAYRLQSIERGTRQVRFKLLDPALNEISDLTVPSAYSFDPRVRPWYVEAISTNDTVQTAPYIFFTTREVGQTIARRAEHGRAVVGADITLKQLSETLALARPSPSSQLAVFGEDRSVIAQSEPLRIPAMDAKGNPVLPRIADLSPVLAAAVQGPLPQTRTKNIEVDAREWLVRIAPVTQTAKGMTYIIVATPSDELLTEARAALRRNLWLALALVLLSVPFTWWIARRVAANLNALTDQAAAIRRFNFDKPAPLRSRVIEIRDLGFAMGQMRETISKFMDITTALSTEHNFDRLLRRVLQEARDAAGAEGGVIYLLAEDGRTLKPADQSWNEDTTAGDENLPDFSMWDESNPVARAARSTEAHGAHALAPERPAGLEFLDARFDRLPVLLITVPLLDRGGAAIGVLCLFLRGSAQPSQERLALVRAFAGAGGVAIDNQRLLAAQKALLNSLIKLIARAIDAKSHYTAGHCERVPQLTNMLTRVACEQKEGPFAGFNLDEEQWEALHIAGGLHDCGKVTTPEYVVDKATKLETLHDRIHEVRMRFEVLKRDAEIACLKAISAGGNGPELQAALAGELRTLDEEFAFIAGCNEGGEFMEPEKVERLKMIACRTWQRTLDDRLGVSWEEAERKARMPAQSLPATEHLLADKPEHIIERQEVDLMSENNPWGFKLKMPAALYNRGELYNLSIARGTLEEEGRYKINDHIVQTIIMLSTLPFPKHLKAVPELAGGHHEKMDGTGYPKRLSRDEMSIPARIMAIADIFEALTAADRPYKKAKKLSEAIRIMSFMKKDRHIDPELFDLFLSSGVYLQYAEKFMHRDYIDEVDVRAYLGVPS